MLLIRFAILAFACCGVAAAADPVAPKSPFPPGPVAPAADPPKADPRAVPVLNEDSVYIVKDDAEFVLRASPKGLVKIERASSPYIFGKFVNGDGTYNGVQFKEKNVAIVTAMKDAKGRVELIFSPAGAKDDSTDLSQMIDVNGPRPPPKIDDKKDDISPAPKPAVKSFRVIFVYDEKKKLTPEQHSTMYSQSVTDWMIANTTKDAGSNGFRRKDWKATAELDSPAIKAAWAAVQPSLTAIPCVVVIVNDHADILDYPSSPEAAIALFESYKNPKK